MAVPSSTLVTQAGDEILKKIIEWVPETDNPSLLVDLAEAYALVTGKVTSRSA